VKLFLPGGADIRFLELEQDARWGALRDAVGRALADAHRLAYEDGDGHRVTLRGQEDLDLALRSYARGGGSYFRLSAERVAGAPGEEAERAPRRGLLRGWRRGATDGGGSVREGDGSDGDGGSANGGNTTRRSRG
jgi:hypothetical protein